MKILVIGSGGREHALCHALKSTASVTCSPGNAGIMGDVPCIELNGFDAIIDHCRQETVDLVVIGPEQPLVDGLADALEVAGIAVFGPSQKAAQLEGSKDFTKKLCDAANIPTAAYATFDAETPALDYVRKAGAPIVIKADGLAAGKGVTVAMSLPEAESAINECFDGRFGAAGTKVVIEEYMEGDEVSFFALCDGETAIPFASAQDHKRVGDGDTGPNTGGMGTYSPAAIFTPAMQQEVMERIIHPAVKEMKAQGMPYKGVLFAGLMLTKGGPKLIEFNCRFGDPETQVMLPRVQGDLAALLLACATGKLKGQAVTLSNNAALCVVMAAKGYPGDYEKGSEIRGLEQAEAIEGIKVYHAGTRRGRNCGKLKANGGRVLGVVAVADSIAAAQAKAYQAVDQIHWPQGFCRRDIGWRAIDATKKTA